MSLIEVEPGPPRLVFDCDNEDIDRLVAEIWCNTATSPGDTLFKPLYPAGTLMCDEPLQPEATDDWIDFSLPAVGMPVAHPPVRATSDWTLAAVDTGSIKLGQTETGGVAFAVRGALVVWPRDREKRYEYRYNAGPLFVDDRTQLRVLRHLGEGLGQPDYYVTELAGPPYFRARRTAADTANQLQDRVRNYVERMIQQEALRILEPCGATVLLLDGCLPAGRAGSFDTPAPYLEDFLRRCHAQNVGVVALAQRTKLTIGGRPLESVFRQDPRFVGCLALGDMIAHDRLAEGRQATDLRVTLAEQVFAARFGYGPVAATFRADVQPVPGHSCAETLDYLSGACAMVYGYPRPLVDAHHGSAFTRSDVTNLQVALTLELGLRPEPERTLAHVFHPQSYAYK